MNRLEGKVALITGGARGQGRSHALRLAREGADIIALDIAGPVDSNVAPPASPEDLAETARLVEQLDRRCVTGQVDIRDLAALQAEVDAGVAELCRLDVVVGNAGSWTYGLGHELSETEWADVIAVNLTGAWHTCKATIPRLLEQGTGGSIILTSSAGGLKGIPNLAHYVAAKHGVVGLMRTLAMELGPHSIRVNTVNPGSVDTDLINNQATFDLFRPDVQNPTREQAEEGFASLTLMPVGWVQPEDISAAVAYLASEDARFVTGTSLSVDAGSLAK